LILDREVSSPEGRRGVYIKVVDIQAISYDRKRKSIMKRTTKKRRLTLDRSVLITT
jgi:hypothetical protein